MIENIGIIIKTLRHKAKLTQSDFCGDYMDRTILSKIENNIIVPSISQIEYIAKKLNIPINYFFNSFDYVIPKNSSTLVSNDSLISNLYHNCRYNAIIKLYEFCSNSYVRLIDSYKDFYVGMSYYNLGLYNNSIKLLKKYINKYLKCSTNIQEAEVINFSISLNTISKIMLQNSNYLKAKQYLYLAKKYLLEYNQLTSTISYYINNNLGYVLNSLDEFNKTISVLEQFTTLSKENINITVMPYIHWSLGKAYYNISKYDNARAHIYKSIYLLKYSGNAEEVGRCYINYLNILRYSKQYSEALNTIRICKAEFIYNMILMNKFLVEEMAVYFNLGDFEKILDLYTNIEFSKLTDVYRNCVYFMIGHTYCMVNNLNKAKNYLIKCQKYFISQDYSYDLVIVYEDLYNITKSDFYLVKLNHYKSINGKRNIVA
ncbi:hypothetical protein [Candidatus Clostridium radicumherbarum]|uniref:HTH cro/C1-type domain-containing protein n=1 Tax=Candidatus Clostridium radicumherbarum TaxID=3381662 RepID=A0ABW8TQN4_9CLOT